MLSLPYIAPRDDLWAPSSFRPSTGPSADHHSAAHRQHQHAQDAALLDAAGGGGNALHAHQHALPFRLASAASPPGTHGLALTQRLPTQHGGNLQQHHQQHHQHSYTWHHLQQHAHQSLATQQLAADERAIAQRKLNVRRFGAGWLRPPGVAKTLQARLDEEVERREQAEIARREAQLAELAAASAAAAANADAGAVAAGGEMAAGDGMDVMQEQVEPGEEERDLDADVPDADAMVSEEDEDEDEDTDEEEDTNVATENDVETDQGDTTGFVVEASRLGDESMLEGSLVGGDAFSPARAGRYLDAEDAELDGRAQDMRDLGVERDLDDEIPEAGSYEHTDTEAEDDSDSSDDDAMEEDMAENDASELMAPETSSRRSQRHLDLSVLDDTVEDMMDSSFLSYMRPSHPLESTNTSSTGPRNRSYHNSEQRRAQLRRLQYQQQPTPPQQLQSLRQQPPPQLQPRQRTRAPRGRWSGASEMRSSLAGTDVSELLGASAESSPVAASAGGGAGGGAGSVMARLRAAAAAGRRGA